MNVQKYIDESVSANTEYTLTDEDNKIIKHEGMSGFIFRKLNSSKFKSQAISPDYLVKVREKIALSINHNRPIHLTLPFGATKNPYLPTAPGIDWGEVFNIAYLRQYVSPIAKAYKHGVILHYISVGIFEEKVNRIPQKDVDLYDQQFNLLLDKFKAYLPDNMKLKYSRVSDEISQPEINRLLDIKIRELERNWNKQDKKRIEYKLLRAERNVLLKPNEQNNEKLIFYAALGHDAFCSECWAIDSAPWNHKDMITLGHNYTNGWAIHVRSAQGSSVNFWSGIGILETRDGQIIPNILSKTQFDKIQNRFKQIKISGFGDISKNLKQVLVLE